MGDKDVQEAKKPQRRKRKSHKTRGKASFERLLIVRELDEEIVGRDESRVFDSYDYMAPENFSQRLVDGYAMQHGYAPEDPDVWGDEYDDEADAV